MKTYIHRSSDGGGLFTIPFTSETELEQIKARFDQPRNDPAGWSYVIPEPLEKAHWQHTSGATVKQLASGAWEVSDGTQWTSETAAIEHVNTISKLPQPQYRWLRDHNRWQRTDGVEIIFRRGMWVTPDGTQWTLDQAAKEYVDKVLNP